MIVAMYARVSTQRQENEETIETQIMAINDFVTKNGHTIVKEYRDDGWSGTLLARPSLDELRLDARKKIWEAVVIYDPDRLARKYSYQELVTDELNELGIQVLYVTTPPIKDDGDRLLYGVKGLFAEYERAKIAERFRLGKLRKARDGNVVTSQAPYGYDYILKQGDKQGFYKINTQEAEVVKMIFRWVANERITIRTIVKRLKKMGIKPRKSEREVWNTSTLSTLLRRKDYIGTTYYNRSYAIVPEHPLKDIKYKRIKKTSRRFKPKEDWISISAPAILDVSLYQKVQKQLKENYELTARNVKNKYLLSGKIYCSCGRRRTGEGPQKGKHLYYRCTDRVYMHPLPRKCHEKGINARMADKLVWDGISNYMTSPNVLKAQVKRWMSDQNKEVIQTDKSVEELKKELGRIKKEEQRYIKAYGAEMIDSEQLKESTEDLKKQKKSIEQQIFSMQRDTATGDISYPNDNEIDEFCRIAYKVIADIGFEAKQSIIRKVVDTAVGTQHDIKVYGHLPINSSIIANIWKGDTQDVKFETSSRNRGFA
ncbi:recombinase family protein [Candidatus Microgenomates bacterium]|nr:MAG: recombinase family protein [Candidatus Microgenomates bacterium]